MQDFKILLKLIWLFLKQPSLAPKCNAIARCPFFNMLSSNLQMSFFIMNICNIIAGLEKVGGAELMLKRLIDKGNYDNKTQSVICLGKMGQLGKIIKKEGTEVFELKMNSLFDFPRAFYN